jgi:hypothetical protein
MNGTTIEREFICIDGCNLICMGGWDGFMVCGGTLAGLPLYVVCGG